MSYSGQRVLVKVNGQEYWVEVGDLSTKPIIVVVDGQTYEVIVEERSAGAAEKTNAGVSVSPVEISLNEVTIEQVSTTATSDTRVVAPLPGDIIDIKVQSGQDVVVGDSLCVIDAMKMRNEIRSPRDGRIASVEVSMGQSVDYGDLLITYE